MSHPKVNYKQDCYLDHAWVEIPITDNYWKSRNWLEKYKEHKLVNDGYGNYTQNLIDRKSKCTNTEKITWGIWEFQLIETTNTFVGGEVTTKLRIGGCASMVNNCGKNYGNISLEETIWIYQNICNEWELDYYKVDMSTPELSVTFEVTNLNPEDYFGNLIFPNAVNKKRIEEMENSDGKLMGYYVHFSHYTLKIYFPDYKFREVLNTVRFERQYNKKQTIIKKTAIRLYEFLKPSIMDVCLSILQDDWLNDVIIIDPNLKPIAKGELGYNTTMNKIYVEEVNTDFWYPKIVGEGIKPQMSGFKKLAHAQTLKKCKINYSIAANSDGKGLHQNIMLQFKNMQEARLLPYLEGNNSDYSINTSIIEEIKDTILLNTDFVKEIIDIEEVSTTVIDYNINKTNIMKEVKVSTPVIKLPVQDKQRVQHCYTWKKKMNSYYTETKLNHQHSAA